MLLAVVAFLASCDNDDITISSNTNIKVNASGVISPFKYKVHPDDLESFNNQYFQLRIRVLAYDEEGILVAQGTQYASNYNVTENFNLDLPIGQTYTLVAITDLQGKANSSVSEFWHLSDSDRIATTKLTDTGYIGHENKILGLGSATVTVSKESQEININPTPAGALIYVDFQHIHYYTDVERWTLGISKTSDNILLNKDGSYSPSVQSNNGKFDWRLTYIEPLEEDNANYNGIYGYYFELPMENVGFELEYLISGKNSTYVYPDTNFYLSFEAGKQYGIIIDLCDADHNNQVMIYNGAFDDENSSAKAAITRSNGKSIKSKSRNSVYLTDLIKTVK